jgi:hypothetical protein
LHKNTIMNQLLTEYPLYYSIFAIATAIVYAWLLYRKNPHAPWNKTVNYILAGLRFTLVFLLCFLLLNPFIKQIANEYEKPLLVFAIDNSQSLPLTTDSSKLKQILASLANTSKQLENNGFEIAVQTFDSEAKNLQAINFNYATSPLSEILQNISQTYENRTVNSIVLLSDGMYNQGTSPNYASYRLPIHTIGIGDSIAQKDINLKAVFHNALAYLGNKFPIEAEIYQTGFAGKTVEVALKQNGNIIERKNCTFSQNSDFQRITFIVEAKNKGMQHYTIEVEPNTEEFTTKNNIRHAYIDIIDGKQKILLIAAAPHPDIKAIRSAIDKKELYQLDVFIPNISPEGTYKANEKYDLVIFHNIPNKNNFGNQYFEEYTKKGVPIWYLIGTETNLATLNKQLDFLKINSRGTQFDKVMPWFNPNFTKFTFEDSKKKLLAKYPPVTVFFASYQVASSAQVLLYQRVGNIETQNPLLLVNDNMGNKTAVLTGEGIWQWRITENAQQDSQEAFDELITKTIQYLASKDDKRKFRVVPTSTEDNNNGSVTFETETYNDSYENIFGQKIDLTLTNEKGINTSYSYVHTDANFTYKINGLPQGVYSFKASTTLNNKAETSKGEFTIKEQATEAISTVADFALLRQLAKQSGGMSVHANSMETLQNYLLAQKPIQTIHSSETMQEVIHLKWIFFLLIGLVSTEWFIRKFKGAY